MSESTHPPAEPIRVLVADDNEDAGESLAILLRLLGGYEVQNAFDGMETLNAVEAFRPHVVLLDIGMPRKSGYDVARELRARPYGPDLLLIAVTGWGESEQRKLSAEAGFDHHFVKPVHPRDLKPVIEAHAAQLRGN